MICCSQHPQTQRSTEMFHRLVVSASAWILARGKQLWRKEHGPTEVHPILSPYHRKKPQINVTIDKQLCVWIFLCFIDVSSSSIWTRKTCVAHVDGTSHSVSCSAIPQWARRFPKLSALTIRNWHPCFSFFWNAWEEWSLAKRTQQFCLSVRFSNIISMEFNQLFPQVTCLSKSTLFNVSFSQEIMNVYPGVVLPLVFPVCQGIHNVPMFVSYFFPKKFQVPNVLFLNSSLWLQGKSRNVIPRLSHEIPMES